MNWNYTEIFTWTRNILLSLIFIFGVTFLLIGLFLDFSKEKQRKALRKRNENEGN